ncbi:His Kinase A domain containing protein, partial [Entomortierella lignicola]
SSHQKSLQRRKSEGTSLRASKMDQGLDSAISSSNLGLTSIPGKSFLRNGKTGIDTSVDQLKVSEGRTRRISESALSTSSKLSGSGLAEKLSGLAQTVRGLSRSQFTPDLSSPTTTPKSLCSTSASPVYSPQYPATFEQGVNSKCQTCSTSKYSPEKPYESWDDFLFNYRKGHFPECHVEKPQINTELPPTPPYISSHESLPFLAPPLPPDEEKRLRALHSFQILKTGIDPNFERIVQLVARVMGASRCVITLVDYEQVSVKAQYPSGYSELPREHSLCAHTILRYPNDPMVVLDAKADWRFNQLPSVLSGSPVRFYAGAPLTTSDKFNVGALCLVDSEPRTSFTEREKSLLVDFAAVVMREMELWNDQVQLCIRNRMMRDVTRWVRGCLDIAKPDSAMSDDPPTQDFSQGHPYPSDTTQMSLHMPSDISGTPSRALTSAPVHDMGERPALISPPIDPIFPTPSGSPTLLSCAFGPSTASSGNSLEDKAFPAACILIQATLNVDSVYLVQASANQTIIPPSGSSIVWNYLDAAGHRKGSVGAVKGGHVLSGMPNMALTCLASSKKDPRIHTRPVLDERIQHTKRQGSSWVCTDEGCRPHRLGDALLNAAEPDWNRDLPILKEMLGYVRQELHAPPPVEGEGTLFTCSQGQSAVENDWFGATVPQSSSNDPRHRRLLCHTFQGTLKGLAAGATTPYQSAFIVPILGPSSAANDITTEDEPWAYFVILSASNTKQFSFHERIYLKNFGSCLVTEVMKRRVEAADRAKGTFIKSISHEFRTPLHIILGVLELLNANPEEPLSDSQLELITDAETAGKTLNDTISNIIDLAILDPDNGMEAGNIHNERSASNPPKVEETTLEEVDIRELCQNIAESLAKACTEKNVMLIPSWAKPPLSSLSSSTSNSGMSPIMKIPSNAELDILSKKDHSSLEDPINECPSSTESLGTFTARKFRSERKRRSVLELIVAIDEPERDPDQDTFWSFTLDVKSITRILTQVGIQTVYSLINTIYARLSNSENRHFTQLVENAIKFTSTGFVEISATPLTHSPIPMEPPHPSAHPILFTVRDTGKGISAEFVQSHLFKRFSQENPLKVGTGLGLALVKELVKKLGGWMEVWSEGIEGKGCVVKVLVWGISAANQAKSIKDIKGPWQNKSCRFYAGESSVGSDRLFKIMGERMMAQQFNMNIEKGDEQDVSPEDMLKDLNDQSRCDLLIINDDHIRLKTYLSHWAEYHHAARLNMIEDPEPPTPLLILTAPPHMKRVQGLVNEYLETQIDSATIERPTNIVIMTKPIGPVKLLQCLRECFTPAFSNPHLQTPQGSPQLSAASGPARGPPILVRPATAPHFTTTTLGVHDNRQLSAGTILKQSFVSPMINQGDHEQRLPPHSPGGLVLPPRILNTGPSPATTPEHETYPTRHTPSSSPGLGYNSQSVTPQHHQGQSSESATNAEFKANIDNSVPNLQPHQSIRNFQKAKKTFAGSDATPTTIAATPPATAADIATTTISTTTTDSEGVSSAEHTAAERSSPRVLIVEDNITNRMILRTFLKKRGIDVVEAENGKLGVERFQEEVWRRGGKTGFEFVLMDLQMPVMDGNVATKQIRAFEMSMAKQCETNSNSGSDHMLNLEVETCANANIDATPTEPGDGKKKLETGYRPTIIFALTGLAAEEDKRLAFECGVDGYMTKPVSLRELGSLMSSCLPTKTKGQTAI